MTPDSISQRLVRFADLHLNLAKDTFPNGGVLVCPHCGHREPFTVEQAAHYLKDGWPKHCHYQMLTDTAASQIGPKP